MDHIADYLNKRKLVLSKKPRFTVVYHEARERLGLSVTEYIVLDSIHILSHSNDRYPYCTMSKDDMAKFLSVGRATVFRAIERGLQKVFWIALQSTFFALLLSGSTPSFFIQRKSKTVFRYSIRIYIYKVSKRDCLGPILRRHNLTLRPCKY